MPVRAQREGRGIPPTHSQPSTTLWPLHPWQRPQYPLCRRLAGPQGPVWTAWKILLPPGFDPLTVQLIASHYTNYAILPTIINHNMSDYFHYCQNLKFHIFLTCLLFLQVWMSKGPGCDVPIHVIMLALYIELQLGVYSLTAVSYSYNSLDGGPG
jgi:hypothetical protein